MADGEENSTLRLTKCEEELVPILVKGLPNKEIWEALNLSTFTIHNLASQLLTKCSVKNRTELAARLQAQRRTQH